MQDQQHNSQQPQQSTNEPAGAPAAQQGSVDERDAQIKAEPDTARLRSERQSVIDGEQQQTETP